MTATTAKIPVVGQTYTVCRYVPHRLADAYRDQGWDVRPMAMHHGRYSHIVSMEFAYEPGEKMDTVGA
ncbi:MAG: hypothetical protein GC201_01100 [Alphaproteobacteria bacterium]|nr:hypothetical protein [Alphaproteobacteria bacterium]